MQEIEETERDWLVFNWSDSKISLSLVRPTKIRKVSTQNLIFRILPHEQKK